ncbi:GFA family protein [Wenxinia marina]|uniref:CENP-V/GFA domain-containing protein n=1 Tax=Wenxinia marina DSM 24838 TaxID=1123501 RepID=A0A0D0PDX8_9RHOB|nr:GFA family protein [Wenxinia marina]KIQ69626.1 hypothetical protein Wenmar_01990 [Wenxinia marina DSM 24838]GGL59881.1 aldehyde-activating protein [Wenxinia marina]
MAERTYHGTCHCGRVAFELRMDPLATQLRKCNCSYCMKAGYKKALMPFDTLTITRGAASLGTYHADPSAWPPGTIDHYFCPSCGVQTFSRGELDEMGGEFWAVNLACLDDLPAASLGAMEVVYEDGRNDRQDRAPEITAYL